MARPFYVYMLRCVDGSYYTGQTDDLEKRVAEHQLGGKCLYTTTRRPVVLVWSLGFPTRDEAKLAEARLKKWSRAKKEALCSDDIELLRAAAKKTNWAAYRARNERRLG